MHMHIDMHVHIHIHMHVHIHIHIHMHVHVHLHIQIPYAYTQMCIHANIPSPHSAVPVSYTIRAYVHTCIHARACVHACMCAYLPCLHVCMRAFRACRSLRSQTCKAILVAHTLSIMNSMHRAHELHSTMSRNISILKKGVRHTPGWPNGYV